MITGLVVLFHKPNPTYGEVNPLMSIKGETTLLAVILLGYQSTYN
jgi:hypothetical protein